MLSWYCNCVVCCILLSTKTDEIWYIEIKFRALWLNGESYWFCTCAIWNQNERWSTMVSFSETDPHKDNFQNKLWFMKIRTQIDQLNWKRGRSKNANPSSSLSTWDELAPSCSALYIWLWHPRRCYETSRLCLRQSAQFRNKITLDTNRLLSGHKLWSSLINPDAALIVEIRLIENNFWLSVPFQHRTNHTFSSFLYTPLRSCYDVYESL